ncbi:unnamed protein product [Rotaria sp. Silwood2]|nr:unnamed protein product [Rotaria sp. Silwood2]
MNDMKILLSKCSRLKHFELHITSKNRCFDGDQWEILTRSLLTFNFMIYVNRFWIDQYSHEFRSPFWLEKKHWYVAYYNQYLFSVPHFALAHIDISNQSFIYSTIPTMINIYNCVTKITIDAIPDKNCAYFSHVDVLVLKCSISLSILSSIVDLNRIKVLVLWILSDILRFIPIKRTLPHLWILIVTNCSRIDAIKDVRHYHFEQIRKLKINIKKQSYHNIMKDLFGLFPCVEYLIIHMSSFPSKQDIMCTMDVLKYLTNLSFYIDSSISDTQKTFYQDLYSIIQPSQKSMKDNFKYRFYQSSDRNDSFSIHWWISPYSLEDA